MSALIVMPTIHPPYRDACFATMSPQFRDRLVMVDNSGATNLGLAASWNVGARRVLEEGHDWLVTISAGMRFGKSGGDDVLATLDSLPEAWVVEFGWDIHDRSELWSGWHLIGWSRRNVLERIGLLDENFWPIYGEDADWSLRLLAALDETPNPDGLVRWETVDRIDAWLVMAQHSGELAGVRNDYPDMDAYFQAKWGRSFSDGTVETYQRPFNEASRSLAWWPSPPDPRHRAHGGWDQFDPDRLVP